MKFYTNPFIKDAPREIKMKETLSFDGPSYIGEKKYWTYSKTEYFSGGSIVTTYEDEEYK